MKLTNIVPKRNFAEIRIKRLALGAMLPLLIALSGCAVSYTDKQGFDHHIGLYSVKTEKNECVVTNTVSSIGLTVDTTKDSGGINVGYRVLSKSYISTNLLVELETDDKGNVRLNKLAEEGDENSIRCFRTTSQKEAN